MNYAGSSRRLVANSRAAMIAAIELYNKPRIDYREEVVVILVVNAWELLFKAVLSKNRRSIYYPKKRGEAYRTLGWRDSVGRIAELGLFPSSLDLTAIEANVAVVARYRDNAVHFYNEEGLRYVLYSVIQTSILNYRDVAQAIFSWDIADEITWQLMPLGTEPPINPLDFLSGRRDGPTRDGAVGAFLEELHKDLAAVEDEGGDVGRVLTHYSVSLQSLRKAESADVVVGVAGAGDTDAIVVERRIDPTHTHPLLAAQVVSAVGELHGKAFTMRDLVALAWRYGWREQEHLCWHDVSTNRYHWSRELPSVIRRLTKTECDRARTAYSAELRAPSGRSE